MSASQTWSGGVGDIVAHGYRPHRIVIQQCLQEAKRRIPQALDDRFDQLEDMTRHDHELH